VRIELYKVKIRRIHNRRASHPPLKPRDLILRSAEAVEKHIEKMGLNLEGPNSIKEEVLPGTYKLLMLGDKEFPNPWHVDIFKCNYT